MIPLSRGSFDVLVGMDRLSKRKFRIVCHDNVVRIPLEGDEILRIHGERTQGVVKTLMNTKVGELKLSVPGATPVAKSPYRLAHLEMQELSEQLQELQDEGFIRPSHFLSPVLWAEIGESSLTGPELVLDMTDKGKLAPRYVGPFEILERVGPVAYQLRLPEELSGIKVDKTLRFVEEPIKNSDREVKRLKCSRMVVVKVHLGSKRGL
ncbi:hypothetical protein Tco_1042677 [Tanacetum coccineum]|uniref:Tf2-1-like SH3-like domain-containing protein n=1 Tax=Tanacetum coccineum TaxID=301880 RepID=A0ABQ5GM42_9ASTR